jgi:translation initiation factor IF-3
VRVISDDGQQLGVMPLPDALSRSREAELDLVLIAPQATPPVAKIMDYGKWRYEEAQKAKESRRKSAHVAIKEMKYRPKIGPGDFSTKTRAIHKFLADGHKVKVTIMFRGREMQHPELGMKILDHVAEEVSDVAKVEATPKIDGRNMVMVLAPDKTKKPVTKSRSHSEPGESTSVADESAVDEASITDTTPIDTNPADTAPAPTPAADSGPVEVPAEPVPAEPEGTAVNQ